MIEPYAEATAREAEDESGDSDEQKGEGREHI